MNVYINHSDLSYIKQCSLGKNSGNKAPDFYPFTFLSIINSCLLHCFIFIILIFWEQLDGAISVFISLHFALNPCWLAFVLRHYWVDFAIISSWLFFYSANIGYSLHSELIGLCFALNDVALCFAFNTVSFCLVLGHVFHISFTRESSREQGR